MDFTKTLKNEMDKKYLQMIDGDTASPFDEPMHVENAGQYIDKKEKYYKRLEKEKNAFNNACQSVQQTQANRLSNEKAAKEREQQRIAREKENKAELKYHIALTVKTIIFLLPVIVCILVGVDVFSPSNKDVYFLTASQYGLSSGWIIALYVFFCMGSLSASIGLTVSMFRIQYYLGDGEVDGNKRFNAAAVIVVLLIAALVTLNIYQAAPNFGKYQVTFYGEDGATRVYVEKGESVRCPNSSFKEDFDAGDYIIKYQLRGWEIDGTEYKPGDKYTPKSTTKATAIFNEVRYGIVKIDIGNNATVTLSYDGETFTAKPYHDSVEIPLGTQVTLQVKFLYSDQTLKVDDKNVENPYTFTLTRNTTIYASSSDPGCLVEGTLVMLKDGTQKRVEDLQMGDVLMVFNHETGQLDYAPLLVNVHANAEADYYNIIQLTFSNNNVLRIVDEHGLFDKDLNRYVYLNEDNANSFIGHRFVYVDIVDGNMVIDTVTLASVSITNEMVKIFNPASVWHINLVADNMLTLSAGMTNLFEYDENMKYDELAMAQDIEKYGLYTYDDFKDYVSYEVFEAFPFKYYKVVVGKGLFEYEDLLMLIRMYNDVNSVK